MLKSWLLLPNPKAAGYDVIASTLTEKLHVLAVHVQFKAYFLFLLADQEFFRVIKTVSKVYKIFRHPTPYHA